MRGIVWVSRETRVDYTLAPLRALTFGQRAFGPQKKARWPWVIFGPGREQGPEIAHNVFMLEVMYAPREYYYYALLNVIYA